MKCFLNEAIHQGVDSLTTGCPPRIPMIRTLQKQGSSNINWSNISSKNKTPATKTEVEEATKLEQQQQQLR